jgi:hypothetical protein
MIMIQNTLPSFIWKLFPKILKIIYSSRDLNATPKYGGGILTVMSQTSSFRPPSRIKLDTCKWLTSMVQLFNLVTFQLMHLL